MRIQFLHILTMAGRRITLILSGFRTISENSLSLLHPDEPDSSFATITSHDTFEFYEYCLANSIALFSLPSHATHVLQPLDVGILHLLTGTPPRKLTAGPPLSHSTPHSFPCVSEQGGKHSHHKISGQHRASAAPTPPTGPEPSATQSALCSSVPTRITTSTRTSLSSPSFPTSVLRLDTSLLLLRLHHLHWIIATISLRISVLHERWKLIYMWQKQSFTRLLPARSLPNEVGLCFTKLAI